jgi:hypothetical protein
MEVTHAKRTSNRAKSRSTNRTARAATQHRPSHTQLHDTTMKGMAMNAQVLSIKGDTMETIFYPGSDEPRPGDWIAVTEGDEGGLIVQVISVGSASYPGAGEAALQELLERAQAEAHVVINREPGLADLKRVKLAVCKIRARLAPDGRWSPWNGWATTRNVQLRRVPLREVVDHVSRPQARQIVLGSVERADSDESEPFVIDAQLLDKINVITGNKGTGKSHGGKITALGLAGLGAPVLVFDPNREYAALPGARIAPLGAGFALSLGEVGFPCLMSVIDSVFPMTETARANLDYYGPRFVAEQMQQRNFANLEYLIAKADAGAFGGGDLVARAIAERLTKVRGMRLFADRQTRQSLLGTLQDIGEHGGIFVLDLSALRPRVQRGVAAGINRVLEHFCEDERAAGTKRYPFVFYEEAHLYVDDEDILNIVTRMRHLGMTTFFVTNRPEKLPEAVMSLVDNLVMLNLGSKGDVRAVAKSALTDIETLESFAVALPPHYALITGAMTRRLPIVVHIGPLPAGTPATGVTQSFWDRVA